MNYLFENLGDERFQELCQCIINTQFSNTQCFPVGQPDGGRDGLAYIGNKGESTVFQVKFSRDGNNVSNIYEWLSSTIKKELPKIKFLAERRNAKAYYLITNVKGSSHLDNGTIDKIKHFLDETIPIPAFCWWRDDLSRFLDTYPLLKWSFCDILNGQDILNYNVFQNLEEKKEKRESVLRAYLQDQYDLDCEVKFKQIELQNNIFDLFVDVPIIPKEEIRNLSRNEVKSNVFQCIRAWHIHSKYELDKVDEECTGAVDYLLSLNKYVKSSKLVVEGGPGQGKSTITQYICQVHRARLLNRKWEIEKIPIKVRNMPLQIPFKIDLRDFASWLNRQNPYSNIVNDNYFERRWQESFESFLIAHIFYHSKIEDFEMSDFFAIGKRAAVLIVLDGFDEIADTKLRNKVVEAIQKGYSRLSSNLLSLQFIITSRPAAFANSNSFPIIEYPHFELSDIKDSTTKEYLEKWIHSKRMTEREAHSIRKLVEEKLKLPHLKELAKSPMQLAILISLLNTRGESLPNKRTSLYDSYIDLFFNRESEKNADIRDQRDLIINIHRYLAWVLHSEAETLKNNGRIEIQRLKNKLNTYLKSEGHPIDLADKLFSVMHERVCALVSRVQGTFEFEVQPLREYFCAKYLYDTAPYCPAGTEKNGTKPDRFEALAKNYYWHNVLRFFAGCFDRGELPMLIFKLKEIQSDPILKYTSFPRYITAQLLSDWVFSQYPKLFQNAIEIILDGINIGAVLSEGYRAKKNTIVLPINCGKQELVNQCMACLKKFPTEDYAKELINIIVNNNESCVKEWKEYCLNLSGEKLTQWFKYGYNLGILCKLSYNEIDEILAIDSNKDCKKLILLINSNQFNYINTRPQHKQLLLENILNGNVFFIDRRGNNSPIYQLYKLLCIQYNGRLYQDTLYDVNMPYESFFYDQRIIMNLDEEENQNNIPIVDPLDEKIINILGNCKSVFSMPIEQWRISILPWDIVVEETRKIFGDSILLYEYAVLSAGIKSQTQKFSEFNNLEDSKQSLCKRIRYARLKSGNVSYWKNILSQSDNKYLALLVLLVWGTAKTIIELLPTIDQLYNILSEANQDKLIESLEKLGWLSSMSMTKEQHAYLRSELNISDKCKLILFLRMKYEDRIEYIDVFFQFYNGNDLKILSLKLNYLIQNIRQAANISILLPEIKRIYLKMNSPLNFYLNRRRHNITLDYESAKIIMSDCHSYPRILCSIAEEICHDYAIKNTKAVGKIAADDDWFEY